MPVDQDGQLRRVIVKPKPVGSVTKTKANTNSFKVLGQLDQVTYSNLSSIPLSSNHAGLTHIGSQPIMDSSTLRRYNTRSTMKRTMDGQTKSADKVVTPIDLTSVTPPAGSPENMHDGIVLSPLAWEDAEMDGETMTNSNPDNPLELSADSAPTSIS